MDWAVGPTMQQDPFDFTPLLVLALQKAAVSWRKNKKNKKKPANELFTCRHLLASPGTNAPQAV